MKTRAAIAWEPNRPLEIEEIDLDDLHYITKMRYKARADEIWVEHELDHILFARTTSSLQVKPNPNK